MCIFGCVWLDHVERLNAQMRRSQRVNALAAQLDRSHVDADRSELVDAVVVHFAHRVSCDVLSTRTAQTLLPVSRTDAQLVLSCIALGSTCCQRL